MKLWNVIKRVFRRLLFWKKRKTADSSLLTEEVKTFYDVELLRWAKAMGPVKMFGGTHCNQPHGGVTVSFSRYTNLADQMPFGTSAVQLPQAKPEEEPCENCLRWSECEGVDTECPLKRKTER